MGCCRTVSLIVVTIAALGAVALILTGAVRTYTVSMSAAAADGVGGLLANFTKCSDYHDAAEAGTGDSDFANVIQMECIEGQAPYVALYCVAGVFTLLATISGLIAGLKESKVSSYSYSIFAAAAFPLLIVAICMMAINTYPATSRMVPCDSFSSQTISTLTASGFICVSGGPNGDLSSALGWLTSLALFYAGAITSFVCMFLFLMSNCCCCNQRDKEPDDMQAPLMMQPQPNYGVGYGGAPYSAYPGGHYA